MVDAGYSASSADKRVCPLSGRVVDMPSVLIADDDLIVADMLEEALVMSGCEVGGLARTVEKAVELDENDKPDLAVLYIWLADGGLGAGIPGGLKSQGHIVKPYCTDDVIRAFRVVEQIVSLTL